MEIARLEVSMQQHLDRMQVSTSNMESQLNQRKRSHNLVQGQLAKVKVKKGQVATGDPDPVANQTNDLLSHLTPATVGKGNITRHRTARLWTLLAEGVARKDITKRFACRVNALHTLWRHHRQLQQGLQPVNPYISMMRDNQFTLTWLVSPM